MVTRLRELYRDQVERDVGRRRAADGARPT